MFLQGFGIQSQDIVMNFMSATNAHVVEEVDTDPMAYAEQFVDSNAIIPQTPEELYKAELSFPVPHSGAISSMESRGELHHHLQQSGAHKS